MHLGTIRSSRCGTQGCITGIHCGSRRMACAIHRAGSDRRHRPTLFQQERHEQAMRGPTDAGTLSLVGRILHLSPPTLQLPQLFCRVGDRDRCHCAPCVVPCQRIMRLICPIDATLQPCLSHVLPNVAPTLLCPARVALNARRSHHQVSQEPHWRSVSLLHRSRRVEQGAVLQGVQLFTRARSPRAPTRCRDPDGIRKRGCAFMQRPCTDRRTSTPEHVLPHGVGARRVGRL